jgi:hypothetical protein
MWWPETGLNRRRRPFQGRALPLSYLASVQTIVATSCAESGVAGEGGRVHEQCAAKQLQTVYQLPFSTPNPLQIRAIAFCHSRHASPRRTFCSTLEGIMRLPACLACLFRSRRRQLPPLRPASITPKAAPPTPIRPPSRPVRGPARFLASSPRAPTCTSTSPARSMRRASSARPARTACAWTPAP